MGEFGFYFKEGIYHITDWKGYDHILFVAALCLPFLLKDWRQLLILITAFTIGHSITLALSVFNKIIIASSWIEFLIPVTIVLTALANLVQQNTNPKNARIRYVTAMLFGLIHGLGFSNYLKSMMSKDESIFIQLLGFNIGLEAGQLFIVAIVLLLSAAFVQLLKVQRREWIVFMSGGIFSLAFLMALSRSPF
jgi:hypothetical protein